MDRRNCVVALSARAQRGVALSQIMIRFLRLSLAPSRIVIFASPRVGPPTLLRRRRLVLLLDRGAAELGTLKMARLPAVVDLADAVNGGADSMLVILILLLVMTMGTMMVKLRGLCHGSVRLHGFTYPIRLGELTRWAPRGGEPSSCRRREDSMGASPSRGR